MSKITVQIGFYLQGQHYAQMQAFLPRVEAIKIPQLKIQHRSNQIKLPQINSKRIGGRTGKSELSKSQRSESKKGQSEEEINEDQDQNLNEMENQQEEQPQDEDQIIDDDQIIQDKVDSQKQQENLMMYLEEDDDSEDNDIDDEEDLSSISHSMSVIRSNHKTKRQKGDRQGLQELPDRRPRKDKKLDEATQIIRREEKQRKRKQYLKKQVEAQQKATLDKILNETGRKLKLREEKQNQDERKKQDKRFNNLGDKPKVITIENRQGGIIMLHNVQLFSESMTRAPQVKIKPSCNKCGAQEGRYKIKNTNNFACSLNCYKLLV